MTAKFDFYRPARAIRRNLKIINVTPWVIVSGWSGVVADVLTPLAPNASIAFGILAILTALLFFHVAATPVLDSMSERLETYGNAMLICMLLSLGFASIWAWQIISNSTERGALVQAVPSLQALQDQIVGIKEDTGAIRRSAEEIANQTRMIKKEVSEDPRKELANMGLTWTAKDFLEQIKNGDHRSINLFLEGGMSPNVKTDQSVMAYAIAWKIPNFEWLLNQAVAYGFDLNAPLDLGSDLFRGWPNVDWKRPVFVAAMSDNDEALLALIRKGADTFPLRREFISAVAVIDEKEAEEVRMKDARYCAQKYLRSDRARVIDFAKSMAVFDEDSYLDTIHPDRDYLHTAMRLCEFSARNPQRSYLPEGVVSKANYGTFKRVLALLR